MLHEKKYIIIAVIFVSLAVVLLFIFYTQSKNPADIIKSKIRLKLPITSKIIKFNYNGFSEDFEAKVQISNSDVENIKEELLSFFKQEYIITNIENLPHNKNFISWWDMDKNNIEVCYKTVVSGKKHMFVPSAKSAIIWVFVVKQDDQKYYLYISCHS